MRISFKHSEVKKKELSYIEELKDILGTDARIHIEWSKELPILNSGKRKIIINEWKQERK